MKKLQLKLENCYGIKKLEHDFDFSERRVYAIYAPNGSMKSSLAQTFHDIAESKPSKDRVFPDRVCIRSARDEDDQPLEPTSIVVLRPYDEEFAQSEKTSTLLVDGKLRKEYESLHAKIEAAKDRLIKALRDTSGSKRDIASEVARTFTKSSSNFFGALRRIRTELSDQKDAPFAGIKYDRIFDEKILDLLGTKDVKSAIESYIRKYNELLASSTYFKKGVFTYYNAATIAKSLSANGFFEAQHSVRLNADSTLEITTQKQLEELIQREKEALLSDAELKKRFLEVEKLIQKNEAFREFEAYLSEHEWVLPNLANVDLFREEVWKYYLKDRFELYIEVVDEFEGIQKRRQEIEEEAAKQATDWDAVLRIFNTRFFVPFKVVASNKVSVMLDRSAQLSLGFEFLDGADAVSVKREELVRVLSSGEKKALYLLNVIFEVEVRKKLQQETLFVFDDIADSFDYRNKYAIVQYLNEIAEETCFRQLILTHNFDFFRTLESRFVDYKKCLMATRAGTEVKLAEARGVRNIFVKDWKKHLFDDGRKRLASIAFARNLIEFTVGEADPRFGSLTALLHWKADTASKTQGDLDAIYAAVFGGSDAWADPTQLVVDAIHREAQDCLAAGPGPNFENKIVLAIATRLAAEKFMAKEINDAPFLAGITKNQTGALVGRFKRDFPKDPRLEVLYRVNLITPENIHLNAFMYEPIVDMSDDHLRQLYQDVLSL